jgi:hypothetical protein
MLKMTYFISIMEIIQEQSYLVQTPPTYDNYQTWNRSMEMTLIVKNKFEMVDGSSPTHPITLANHKA